MTTPLDKAVEAMAWDRAVEAVTDALDGEQLKWLASSPPNRKALAAAALQAADDLLREHYWGELRERLLGGGGGRSHGQLHNALRSSSPLSGFAAPQPKPDEGEGSVVSGTGSSVEQDTVQGLVEALEEAVAGSDELFATNRARRLRLATVRAREALADYKNNTEEA